MEPTLNIMLYYCISNRRFGRGEKGLGGAGRRAGRLSGGGAGRGDRASVDFSEMTRFDRGGAGMSVR